jgi:hypothetical protein
MRVCVRKHPTLARLQRSSIRKTTFQLIKQRKFSEMFSRLLALNSRRQNAKFSKMIRVRKHGRRRFTKPM